MRKAKFRYNLTLVVLLLFTTGLSSAQEAKVTIHIHGVYDCKVSLIPLSGNDAYKPVAEKAGIKSGETTTLLVDKERLPSIFVLRFDYRENRTSSPYPCEKQIILYNQDLEMWVNPMHCNNPDSTRFQTGETENTVMTLFAREAQKRKEMTSVLQNFLLAYDDTKSKVFIEGVKEYEKRRKDYNNWIAEQIKQHNNLFASRIFSFHYMPDIRFQGDESERIHSLIDNYFAGMNFGDPLLLKTTELKGWMDSYVNLYASLMTRESDLDSLFTLAGYRAIETARKGHPLVYGWMVDYFFNGYESINIEMGIKMLEPYLNDSLCLTSKRQAIEKRLKGIATLNVGAPAPDFMVYDINRNPGSFREFKTDKRYKLVLFWSADCGHCAELLNGLYNWLQLNSEDNHPEIFALNLDDQVVEKEIWEKTIPSFPGWNHIRCQGGINSYEAEAYYILSTPVMFLVDARTNTISAVPESLKQLTGFFSSQK